MGQLVLRLDKQVRLMQGESSLVAFMQTGQSGILPRMLQETAKWRQSHQQGQSTQSLKRTLWQLMMEQLHARVAKFAAGTEPLIQEGTPAGPGQQLAHPEMESRPEETGAHPWPKCSSGQDGESSKQEDLVIAFQAMYAETAVESKPVVPWRLTFSMRNDEHWVCLQSLLQSSIWGLIGTRLKRPGIPTPASLGLPKNGDTLCFLLSCLALRNNANWCYANASFFAMCWAYGSCSSFQWDHFDCDEHLLEVLRASPIGCTHSLEALFPILFSHISWGVNPADAAEFTALLHQRGCSQHLTAWERRCEVSQKVTLHDHGTKYMPIVLQHTDTTDHADFDQLLTAWTQELGMVAAFTMPETKDPAALMCCHIDRAVQQSGANGVAKRSCAVNLDTTCLFPFFLDDGLDVIWYGYVPVAMLVHTGTWEGGHWRTVVRFHTQPLDDAVWFVTDDNLEMQLIPRAGFYRWTLEGMTTIWFCKDTCLSFWTWRPLKDPNHWPLIKRDLLRRAPQSQQLDDTAMPSQETNGTEAALGDLLHQLQEVAPMSSGALGGN